MPDDNLFAAKLVAIFIFLIGALFGGLLTSFVLTDQKLKDLQDNTVLNIEKVCTSYAIFKNQNLRYGDFNNFINPPADCNKVTADSPDINKFLESGHCFEIVPTK